MTGAAAGVSLEEAEKDFWGDAPGGSSRLVATVHELRRRPIESLGVEDLRVLIGQRVGLGALIPLALRVLENDPLAEGDFYPGDLLVSVLRVPAGYWQTDPALLSRTRRVAKSVDLSAVDPELAADIAAYLTD